MISSEKQFSGFEALILAGGLGTRLGSVLNDRPKPMAPVHGRPFLEWLILSLRSRGIRRVVLCTGHMGEMVETYFGDGLPWDIELRHVREPSPLGTGGAVRHALHGVLGERFFVLNGDSYCRADFRRLADAHTLRNAQATIWLVRHDDCRRYGSVAVGEGGEVLAFREKSTEQGAGLINAGIYMMERSLVETIREDRAVSLESEVFPGLIGHGLYAEVGDGPFLDIGTPESYGSAEDFFVKEASLLSIPTVDVPG